MSFWRNSCLFPINRMNTLIVAFVVVCFICAFYWHDKTNAEMDNEISMKKVREQSSTQRDEEPTSTRE